MIQNIYPKKYDNRYLKKNPQRSDFAMIFDNNKILVKKGADGLSLPKFGDVAAFNQNVYDCCQYLFAIDEESFFLVKNCNCDFVDGEHWQFMDQTVFRGMIEGYEAFGGITAFQLNRWYNSNKYCGGCGSVMKIHDQERALVCPQCGKIVYPRINPAVIIAVNSGDKLLLTQYAKGSYKRYALVAGFVEVGETFEETVAREVWEEVGLRVKNIRYFGSQPWSFTDTVMIGFTAEVDGDDTITLERNELATAQWFAKDEIPDGLSSISIATDLMEHFVKTH